MRSETSEHRVVLNSALVLACLCLVSTATFAADWPQWRGPNRDGKSTETGLLEKWPTGGPKLVWKSTGAGAGYSSFAVVAGRVFTMGNVGDSEFVISFDAKTGKPGWKTKIGSAYRNDRGSGPRGTPTVAGDVLYALGANGQLACLKTTDGSEVWNVSLAKRFGSDNIRWGLSESVLLEDGKVICGPGGKDAAVVALDAKTGKTVWQSKGIDDRAGYASAVAANIDGVRQIVHFNHKAAIGVSAKDGSSLWRYEKANNGIANCATPIVVGNKVFLTSDYGQGCALVEASKSGAEQVYFHKEMQNHHGGVILLGGKLYGHSGGNSKRTHKFVCMDFESGKVAWTDAGIGKCSIVFAEGHLYCLTEDGKMGLVEVSPKQYILKSEFVFKKYERFRTGGLGEEDEKPCWAHPVVSGGRLFLRDQDSVFCYDIAR